MTSGQDISFLSFNALSTVGSENNIFNPGFRNEFKSVVEIELDNAAKVNLFTKGSNYVNISVMWNVYEANASDDDQIVFVDDSNVFQYSEQNINIYDCVSNGTLTVTSYFVIDQNNILNKYSD